MAAALMTTASMMADPVNLVLNPEGEDVVVTATASLDSEHASDAIDGNKGTRWSGNAGEKEDKDATWFQVEWSAAQTFNTVKMYCEGAMSSQYGTHSYTIQVSNDGAVWTTAATVEDGATDAGQYETVQLNNDYTAKYVRLQSTKAQTWGYSFWEFEVYKLDYSVKELTTFTVGNAILLVGEQNPFTFSALDNNQQPIEVELSIEGGTFDAEKENITVESTGVVVVSATAGSVTLTVNLYAIVEPEAPTADEKEVINVYCKKYGEAEGFEIANAGWNWGFVSKSDLAWENTDAIVVTGCGTFGIKTTAEIGDMKTLHLDIFATAAYDQAYIYIEGIDLKTNVAFVAGEWNSINIDITNKMFTDKWIQIYYGNSSSDNGKVNSNSIAVANVYYSASAATAVENASVIEASKKVVRNGQLIIVRDGVEYNAMGAQL